MAQYLLVPLDIPKIQIDRRKLIDFFDTNKEIARNDFLKAIDFPWYILHLRIQGETPKAGEIPGSRWSNSARNEFQELISLIETLPFQHIERVYILEQLKDVIPHQDVSREEDPSLGPSTFRFPLINDTPETTFYILRGSKKTGDLSTEEIYPVLPPDTQWFGMNNYLASHGSHLPQGDSRKLMLCIWGKVQREQWLDLLSKSIKKYRNYCVI